MTIPRASLVILYGITALVLAGCEREKDEIRTITVPKAARAPDEPFDDPADAKVRLLAAMFVYGKNTWFIKLMGPVEAVAKDEPEFQQFVRSLKFRADDSADACGCTAVRVDSAGMVV